MCCSAESGGKVEVVARARARDIRSDPDRKKKKKKEGLRSVRRSVHNRPRSTPIVRFYPGPSGRERPSMHGLIAVRPGSSSRTTAREDPPSGVQVLILG